jgi:hypothetical protein
LKRQRPSLTGEATSDIVNQLTFSGLAVASVFALAIGNGRMLRPLLQVSYGLMLIWLLVGVSVAAMPASAFRAHGFHADRDVPGGLAVWFAARLRAFQDVAFRRSRSNTWLLPGSVSSCFPTSRVHSDVDTFEPEHAGSWRGHLIHKNITGAMMAVLTILGDFRACAAAASWSGSGWWSGLWCSCTSHAPRPRSGLLPIAVALAFVAEKIPFLVVRAGLCLGPVVALNALTLGSATQHLI